ncbi:MAG TPA: helix-turn-helix domain-containing protein [Algoriphagus sp.]|nr:helix-turn-helix domain-containing protein [Algoriphagus sp.]
MEIELVTLADLENLKKEILEEIRILLSGKSKDQADKKWLKSREVQKLLGISPGTLQTLRNRAMIPYTRLGGVIYYNQEEVKKVLEKPEAKPNILFRKSR